MILLHCEWRNSGQCTPGCAQWHVLEAKPIDMIISGMVPHKPGAVGGQPHRWVYHIREAYGPGRE
jgi:hypothetical protein